MAHHHRRYGDLARIAEMTNGRCHICGDSLDLEEFGLVEYFGGGVPTVDHLVPRAYGGGDDPDNLRIAHHGCNSRRGTRDVVEVRLASRGLPWAPLSPVGRLTATVAGGAVGAVTAGCLAARSKPGEKAEFNERAAVAGGVVGALLAYALT